MPKLALLLYWRLLASWFLFWGIWYCTHERDIPGRWVILLYFAFAALSWTVGDIISAKP